MPTSEKELEEKLMEFGNRLCSLPSSVDVDDLLPLLDRIEICLSRVEQSPSESLLKRLAPFIKALVADELLRHADVDVRVAVAACISEITRITAPEAPYDDDQMKDVFQLIVSSFERLYDKSSRSYNKRAAILEIVAKVRSCVVMLDLECDELILAMFDHFLKSIRDNHPENVFSSMETIMTLVLEESEEISPELITSILSCLERDKDVLPVAQKLGEKVLENCASKLKPLLVQVMKSLGKSPENYSKVVENICQGTSGDELNSTSFASKNSADESALAKPSEIADGVDSADQVAKEMPLEIVHPEQVPVATNSSPKSIISNGTMQTEVNDSSVGKDPSPVAEHNGQNEPQASMGLGKVEGVDEEKTSSVAKVQPDEEKASSAAESQTKPEKTDKRRGKRSHPSISPAEPSEPHVDSEREEKVLENVEDERDNSVSSAHEELAADAAIPSVNEKESNAPTSTPIILESQALDGDSPSPISTIPDEIQMKKVGRGRKEEKMIPATSVDSDSVAKVQPDEEKASSVVESQPKPDIIDKSSGKRSHPSISPAEPSEPHVDSKREEKVLDNVEDERLNSVSSPHEELAADAAIPSVNEKESDAPTSTPIIMESQTLDGDSPSPSCIIPDEIQMKKVGRGRKKGKLIPATSVDSDSVAKVQPDEEKASSVAESQPEPEKTDKRRGKRSHPFISPAEPSEPHVDCEREEKVLDNVDDERDTSVSSAHEELAAADAIPSVNEKESNAPTSTPRILESLALDGDSPSPSCTIPDEIQMKKFGRGRKKVKMIPATSVDSDSVAKVQPDEDKASSVAESQPKPEKTDKRRGKRSHPSISPAEPSEPHVDSEREEKVLDNVEDERDNSLSSAHEELAADDAMPSVNEKESNAPTSTPRIPESQALDGDSPSPSCAIPDEIQTNKVGRGRKKGKMITATSVDSDSKKVIEGAIISESKTQKWTGQKAQIAEETSPVPADASNREAGNSKDLDAKLSEQTGKKDKKDDAVVDQLEDRKRRGKGKEPYVNDFLIISLKNDEKKFLSSPKSLAKPSKDESHLEKTTKMNSKRKRAPGKRKASDQSDGDLVGLRISVWWPEDHEFYDGVVDEFDPVEKKHKVTYDDGDVETLVLKDEIWKMADDKLVSLKAHVSDGGSPDASSEMLKGKKRKLTPGPVAKRGRKKRSGVASSSKGKATSSSSTGRKRKGDGKSDTKAKDVRAEDDEKGGKSKDLKDKDSDSPVDNSPKPADDSKFDSIDAIQSSTRAKTDTTKIVGRPKGKTTKSGNKLDSRSAGKLKSGPTKGLEEDAKKSAESAKTPEADRAKSPGLSKAKKSETKSGKKRSRGS
ncbi:hypothetical protein Dimus_020967 [Dionaea muscipula]